MASKAMAQLNSSKFQLSVQKVTQLQKMPLLPGLNEPGNRISITAATAPHTRAAAIMPKTSILPAICQLLDMSQSNFSIKVLCWGDQLPLFPVGINYCCKASLSTALTLCLAAP